MPAKEMKPADYADLLVINKDALEDECANQPEVYHRVAHELALAISRRDEAKIELEQEEARADDHIRLCAEKENQKITEAQVKSAKLLDKEVQKKHSRYHQLSLIAAEWAALKESFQQRSYALNHLVDLYVSSYYGDTSQIERRVQGTDADRVKSMRARAGRVKLSRDA